MTYKQKLQIEYPEYVDDIFWGGCRGCPSDCGYSNEFALSTNCPHVQGVVEGCFECWNREIPEESVERVSEEESNPIDTTAPDVVNHPSHYENARFECIDVMIETQGVEAVKHFCLCNAFKYLYRHNRKEGEISVDKALWYLKKYVELRDGTIENN